VSLEAALHYAARGWEVFPCHWQGPLRKQPLTQHGCNEASTDRDQIIDWWRRYPKALIGFATGRANRIAVLDVDTKGEVNGFDTLEDLGYGLLPVTPMSHTVSGGLAPLFSGTGSR
jgi:putative DNA primase/helicase